MRQNLLPTAILLGFTFLTACGGSNNEPNTPASKEAQRSDMDELKAIPADLSAEVSALTKPIDDIQAALDELGTVPKKHGLAASELMAMARGAFETGKVEANLSGDVSADVRAEVEGSLKKLAGAISALKQTPDKVAALTTKVATATAKVPVLASKVTASASVAASNPFASSEAKAKAQADLAGVQQVQADVMKSISDTQSKLVGIPTIVTSALAKAGASFTST